jgi:parallel beta-helix repeat protein
MKSVRSRALLAIISLMLMASIFASSGAILSAQASGPAGSDLTASPGLMSSPSIHIGNETDLASLRSSGVCTGSGTSTDPYILADRNIASSVSGAAILIGNTTSHLVISNCTLACSAGPILYTYGILISNSSNVQIDHCTIRNFIEDIKVGSYGEVGHEDHITISNSSLYGNSNLGSYVIDMISASHAVIENNLVTGGNTGLQMGQFGSSLNGAVQGSVSDSIVRSNNISYNYGYGIYLSIESTHNIITSNLVSSNGLARLPDTAVVMYVWGSGNQFYANAFVSSARGNDLGIMIDGIHNSNAWNSSQGVGNYWGNQWNESLGANESFIGHSVDWNGQALPQHAIMSSKTNVDYHPCHYIIDAPTMRTQLAVPKGAAVSWTAPNFHIGPAISSYQIVRSDGTQFSVAGSRLSFTDSLPVGWKSFYYTVQARNAWGTGNISVPTFVQNPDRPTLVITSALNGSANGWAQPGNDPYSISPKNVAVEWTGYDSNSSLLGNELPAYQVSLDSGTWMDVESATNHTFDKLIAGKHTVQVKGQDADGNQVITEKDFSVYQLLIVSMEMDSTNATLGSALTANVHITDYATGAVVPGVSVDFYRSVDNGITFDASKFSSASTDNQGNATTSFIPESTSNYMIQARAYSGNGVMASVRPAYANVSLVITPYQGKNAFSVQSTSTVTDLSFDSNHKVLRFTVTGAPGSVGVTKVSIAKSLVADGTNINVSLDQNTLAYTVAPMGDYWVLTFTYHHSTHSVSVGMPTLGGQTTSGSTNSGLPGMDIMVIGLVGAVALVLVAVLLVRRRKK